MLQGHTLELLPLISGNQSEGHVQPIECGGEWRDEAVAQLHVEKGQIRPTALQ